MLSWLAGWLGVTVIVAVVVVWLARRGAVEVGVLLIVVALGGQLISSVAKAGYDRPRPTAGSPIELPSSSSFPSGHAMTGIAVFGLLGLLLAREVSSTRARAAAIAGGLALGALIGASRVALNVHYLTDVLGAPRSASPGSRPASSRRPSSSRAAAGTLPSHDGRRGHTDRRPARGARGPARLGP